MKALYEIVNGYIGESYVRCYAWADSKAEAIELFRKTHAGITSGDKGNRDTSEPTVRVLFEADAHSFCTLLDDGGFPESMECEVRFGNKIHPY